jgi:hypothetical protein
MLIVCDWFFQIDFGDGDGNAIDFGSLDNDSTAGFQSSGVAIEEGNIDWGISTVDSPGETENEVFYFQDLEGSQNKACLLCSCTVSPLTAM